MRPKSSSRELIISGCKTLASRLLKRCAADLYRTSTYFLRHSAALKARSALWSLDAAAHAAVPSQPRINCHTAKLSARRAEHAAAL